MLEKSKVKKDTIELISNQTYDKITNLFNYRRKRLGIEGDAKIVEPIRSSDYFNLDDNDHLTFKYENDNKSFGNINKSLYSPSRMVKELGVTGLYKHNR